MQIEIQIDEKCEKPKVIIITDKMTEEVSEIVKNLSAEREQTIAGFKDDIILLSAFSCQNPHSVDFLVLQEGKGLPPAYRGGRGQGRDFRVKVPFQLTAFPAPQLLEVYQTDTIALQMLHQLGIDGVLAAVQPGHGFPDGLDLLLCGHLSLIVPEILT